MDTCTDAYNLTECLLGQVLDASKEHNKWDIPSLVVTVIIGVVALVFAFATIWQASAGPGRRKSSSSAIGDWAAYTQHRWNIAELSREAIAYTPVITTTMLQHITESSEINNKIVPTNLEISREWRIKTYMKNRALSWLKRKQSPGPRSVGTWLQFLKHTGMERFVWFNPYQVKQTNADYLPSEFQAAPAYMQIDVVVVLAAAAGCDTMTLGPGESYPRITGARAQVRFRSDTSLGVVGSFESFEYTESNKTLEKQPGDAEMNNILKWREIDPLVWLASNFQAPKEGSWPIQYNEKLHDPFEPSAESHINGRHGKALSLCQCSGILQDLIRQHDSQWLLCARPFEQREVFPAERANVEKILATLVVQSSLWPTSSPNKIDFIEDLNQINGIPPSKWELFALCSRLLVTDAQTVKKEFFHLPRDWRMSIRQKITEQIKTIDEELAKHTDTACIRIQTSIISAALLRLEPHEEDIVIIAKNLREKALSYRRPLAAGTGRSPGPRALTDRTARSILAMLQMVNREEGDALTRLYHFFVDIIFCGCKAQEVDILMQSLFNLQLTNPSESIWKKSSDEDPIDFIKQKISILHDPAAKKPMTQNCTEQNKVSQTSTIEDSAEQNTAKQTSVEKSILRELLIYRSILFAFVCLMALDNSVIFDSGVRNHIIPFI